MITHSKGMKFRSKARQTEVLTRSPSLLCFVTSSRECFWSCLGVAMDENLWILERERQRTSRGLLLVPSELGVRPHKVRMNSFRLHVISFTGSNTGFITLLLSISIGCCHRPPLNMHSPPFSPLPTLPLVVLQVSVHRPLLDRVLRPCPSP